MNNLTRWFTIFLSPVMINVLFANPAAVMRGQNSYWQCKAYDDQNHQWVAHSSYARVAINKAYEACKSQSKMPASCKTAHEYCESIIKGVTTRPMWRCTALDMHAHVWVSDLYTNRNDAALGARAYCEHRSGMPETCYVNLLTCNNENKSE
ncbi:hypothetical protein [Legionella impletisoli]|uniref:DUF4189 domain-containing protein n=1 Tax=Legionella impletisoli TaxID=343510 RepID=A0A917JSA7_9GAMM|nr:hypothetical protein [Legionella impletisoli]GGI81369.1 hypothetical protein GCM10007966_07320 [Legionella impletisoli]